MLKPPLEYAQQPMQVLPMGLFLGPKGSWRIPQRAERVLCIFPFGAFGHVHGKRSREIELRSDKASKVDGMLGSVQGLMNGE